MGHLARPPSSPHQLPPALPPQVLAGTLSPCTGHHWSRGAPRARAGVRPESPGLSVLLATAAGSALRSGTRAALGPADADAPGFYPRQRETYKPWREEDKSRLRRRPLLPRERPEERSVSPMAILFTSFITSWNGVLLLTGM